MKVYVFQSALASLAHIKKEKILGLYMILVDAHTSYYNNNNTNNSNNKNNNDNSNYCHCSCYYLSLSSF